MSSGRPTFYIETLGCPKNKVDSRTMRVQLIRNGFRESPSAKDADILLINSCSFIQEAQSETIEYTFESLKIKRQNPEKKVILAGCFVQNFEDSVKNEIPELDLAIGTGKYHQIADILSKKFDIPLHPASVPEYENINTGSGPLPHAYFKIATGCSRSCTFCIIPKIRGEFTADTFESMTEQFEEEKILRAGKTPVREVILVSQDTVSSELDHLKRTLEYFQNQPEVHWLRLHYLFPDKKVLKFLDLFDQFPKLVPYLDIPFQHISPQVLKRMKRPDNPEFFSEIIARGLEKREDMEVRTSFIIGFPDETNSDVEQIERFLETNPVHKMALFRYSHEEQTEAGVVYKDTISEEEKIDRINRLREHHITIRNHQRKLQIGKKTVLMLDNAGPDEIIARRPQDSPDIDEVVFMPPPLKEGFSKKPGDLIKARLGHPMEYDWAGEWDE